MRREYPHDTILKAWEQTKWQGGNCCSQQRLVIMEKQPLMFITAYSTVFEMGTCLLAMAIKTLIRWPPFLTCSTYWQADISNKYPKTSSTISSRYFRKYSTKYHPKKSENFQVAAMFVDKVKLLCKPSSYWLKLFPLPILTWLTLKRKHGFRKSEISIFLA